MKKLITIALSAVLSLYSSESFSQCTTTTTYSAHQSQSVKKTHCPSLVYSNEFPYKVGWSPSTCSSLSGTTYASRFKFKHVGYNNSQITSITYHVTMKSESSGSSTVRLLAPAVTNTCNASYVWHSPTSSLFNCMTGSNNVVLTTSPWTVGTSTATYSTTLYPNSGAAFLSAILDPNSDEFIIILQNWNNSNKVANISGVSVDITYNTPVEANFSANSTSVLVGDVVQFTNLSTPAASCASGMSYNWNLGSGASSLTSANANPAVSYSTAGPKTVSLTSTNANGSDQESKGAYIMVYSQFGVNAIDQTICNGETVSLFASVAGGVPSHSFKWTIAGSSSVFSTLQAPSVSPNSTTVYTVTVTDNVGIVATDNVTVTVLPVPDVQIGQDQKIICPGETTYLQATLVAGNIASYQWSPSAGLPNPNSAITTTTPSSNTTYTVTAIDVNGCSVTDQIDIIINNVTFSAGPDKTVCQGDNTTLTPSATGIGPLTFSWSPTIGLNNPLIEFPLASPSSTTTYTCTVTGSGNCIATDDMILTVDQAPWLENPPIIEAPSCPEVDNGTMQVDLLGNFGPYQILWQGPNFFSANTEDITGIGAGTYYLQVTSGVGSCETNFGPYNVFSSPQTPPTLTVNPSICSEGNCTGSITSVTNDGTAPYSYQWSNNSLSPSITDRCPGTYQLTVTDAVGCQTSSTASITYLTQVDVSLTNLVDVKCYYSGDGQIEVQGTNGNSPYAYSWTAGQNQNYNVSSGGNHIWNLSESNYAVEVTDNNGCTATESYTIGNSNNSTWPVVSEMSSLGDGGNAVASDDDGNIYVVGHVGEYSEFLGQSTHVGSNSKGLFIAKISQCGSLVWTINSISSNSTDIEGVDIVVDGEELYVIGSISGNSGLVEFVSQNNSITKNVNILTDEIFIAKVNLNSSDVLFVETSYPSLSDITPKSITVDQNGDIVICGQSLDQAFVAKCDQNTGLTMTGWPIVSTGLPGNIANDVLVSTENSNPLYVCGSYNKQMNFGGTNVLISDSQKEGFLFKMDASGGTIWAEQGEVPSGTGGSNEAIAIDEVDQQIVITGNFQNVIFGGLVANSGLYSASPNIFISSVDHNGSGIYALKMDESSTQNIYSADITHNSENKIFVHGNFLGSGTTIDGFTPQFNGGTNQSPDMFVACITQSGTPVFTNVGYGNGNISARGITCSNTLAYTTGSFNSNVLLLPNEQLQNIGSTSALYVARNFNNQPGSFIKSSAADHDQNEIANEDSRIESLTIEEKSSFQFFPNPASDKIYLQNDNGRFKKVQILNLSGELILELTDLKYNQQINIEGIASGMYVLMVFEKENIHTKQLVINR